jgi:hypothetical protein
MEDMNTGWTGDRGRVSAITLFGMYVAGLAILASLPGDIGYAGSLLSEKGDPATQQGNCWQAIPRPSTGDGYNQLFGTAALSADDVWVVGTHGAHTLVEHWDGSSWSVVPSPGPDNRSVLHGVTAVAADDVWAVGYYGPTAGGVMHTLVEHWDGTAWSVVPSPEIDSSMLLGVAAVAADDVWAVGYYGPTAGGVRHTLVEHWDGTSWAIVSTPTPGVSSNLYGITAVAADDVWAVGFYRPEPGEGPTQTLVEHWDGSSWTTVPSPSVGSGSNYLDGVSAVAANEVWAVGSYGTRIGHYPPTRTLIMYWDGSSWTIVPSANPDKINNELYGVATVPAYGVWAVGGYGQYNLGLVAHQPLVETYICRAPPASTIPQMPIP